MDDRDDRMERRPHWVPWAITSLVLVIVAMVAYGLGAQREAGAVASTTGPHWHWDFSGIWGFLFLFWIFGGFRWMWGGGCYRPWRHRRYDRRYDDDHDEWQEWHRREHQRMDGSRSESRPIT